MSARRCIWSGRPDERAREVRVKVRDRFGRNPAERSFWVLPEHEAAFRTFCEQSLRYGPRFLLLLGASLLVLLLAAAVAIGGRPHLAMTLAGLSMIFQGGLIVRYPFSTPETVRMLGAARSIQVVRGVGIFNVVVGLGVLALQWIL